LGLGTVIIVVAVLFGVISIRLRGQEARRGAHERSRTV
jgi:hypothetical protein